MARDKEVARIKEDTFKVLADARNVWMIEETGEGFTVRHWSAEGESSEDGVAPSSDYPDKRKAAARLLQLLKTGPVAPQTWPEEVCVGTVTYAKDSA